MQPEPIETSTPLSNNINTSETNLNSQYGFHEHEELQSADLHLRGSPVEDNGGIAASNPASSGTASPPANGPRLQEELARLSLGGTSGENNRPKPSFQRISEYENALSPSPPRKQSEGPGFKVIKKKGRRLDGPQLDQFPNGM